MSGLAAHDSELRSTFAQFEKDLFTGTAAKAYSYASQSFRQKCSLVEFTGVFAFVKAAFGDVNTSDINVAITDVRYDGGKAYVSARTTINGDDFSQDASDSSGGYWLWEDGSWKIATDEASPCGAFGAAAPASPTPGPAGPGTRRDDPMPLGSAVRSGDLEVTVLSADLDATDQVLGASSFAKAPRAGYRYVLVRVRATNAENGEDTVDASEGDFGMTGSANVLYQPYDEKSSCESGTPDRLQAQLFPGGSTEGNVCFQVPSDERNLRLVVSPVFSFKASDRRYLALQ